MYLTNLLLHIRPQRGMQGKEKTGNVEKEEETPVEGKGERSLEEEFASLEQLLTRLEDRDLPLEESFGLYRQGVELLAKCSRKIDLVEKKILVMNEEGGLDEF